MRFKTHLSLPTRSTRCIMDPDVEAAAYGTLSFVPQPLRHPRPGQLGLKPANSHSKGLSNKADAKTSKKHLDKPDTPAARQYLKDKYDIGSTDEEPALPTDGPSAAACQSTMLRPRQHTLQHSSKLRKQAASIRSTAAAVQEWFKWGGPAVSAATEALPAEALLVLNAEANKGLLHMLATGLVPPHLELTPGLCGQPDAPLHSKPTQLHPFDAKHAAITRSTAAVWQTPKPHATIKTSSTQAAAKKPVHPTDSSAAATSAEQSSAQPRGYEDLLDALSEHQLLVFRGKLVQDTPQVVSFIRVAAPLWATVSVLLSQLEAVCRVFKVPLAVIDGKELLQLAQDIRANVGSSSTSGDAPAGNARSAVGLPELLCCIANLEEVEHLFTSVSEEIAAAALAGAGTIAIDAGPAVTAQSTDGHSACQAATPAEPEQQQEIEGTLSLQAGNTESVPTMPAAAQAPQLQRQKVPDKVQKAHGPISQAVVQARRDRDSAFQMLQYSLRHHWQQIRQQQHVVLHLPSLPATLSTYQQEAVVSRQPSQQRHQLWRLLHQADTLTTGVIQSNASNSSISRGQSFHVLVSSSPVSKQLQGHWMQLLKLAGVAEPTKYVRFVSLDPSEPKLQDLPASLPLAAHLMASQKALDRCKHTITGISSLASNSSSSQKLYAEDDAKSANSAAKPAEPDLVVSNSSVPSNAPSNKPQQLPPGYILPGCPCEHDVDVAVKLGLPILGPSPQLAQVLASKIGARSLFAAAGVRVPPGGVLPRGSQSSSEETAWQQLLSGMCLQLLQWPHQQQWMIKLNQSRDTVGLALLELTSMPGTQEAMTFATQHLGLFQQQEQQPALDPQDLSSVAPEELQQVVQQLLDPLAGELHFGLQLAQQQYWEQRAVDAGYAPGDEGMDIAEAAAEMYLTELLHQGGVMEVYLDQLVCCPLVQLLIKPGGVVKILATQDKMLHAGFSSPGSTFPSSCPAHAALVQAATAAGQAALAAGMLGYLQVSFLCTSNPQLLEQQAITATEEVGTAEYSRTSDSNSLQDSSSDMPEALLWGCDALPWPSPDLAIFKVFDSVHRGSFDAHAGQYSVAQASSDVQQLEDQISQLANDAADTYTREEQATTQQQLPLCHYCCLHNPAAVMMAEQLSNIATAGLLRPAPAGVHQQQGSKQQATKPHLHSFGTSGDVVLCLDSSGGESHSSSSSPRKQPPGELFKETVIEVTPGADAAVTGIICCTKGSGVVGALSCLSACLSNCDVQS